MMIVKALGENTGFLHRRFTSKGGYAGINAPAQNSGSRIRAGKSSRHQPLNREPKEKKTNA